MRALIQQLELTSSFLFTLHFLILIYIAFNNNFDDELVCHCSAKREIFLAKLKYAKMINLPEKISINYISREIYVLICQLNERQNKEKVITRAALELNTCMEMCICQAFNSILSPFSLSHLKPRPND